MSTTDEDKDRWLKITNSIFNRDKSNQILNHPLQSAKTDPPPPVIPITNESSSKCHSFLQKMLIPARSADVHAESLSSLKETTKNSKSGAARTATHNNRRGGRIPGTCDTVPKKRIDCQTNTQRNHSPSSSNDDDSSNLTTQMEQMKSQLEKLASRLQQSVRVIDKQKIIIRRQEKKLTALIAGQDVDEENKENQHELDLGTDPEAEAGSDSDSLTRRMDKLEKRMKDFLENLPKRIDLQIQRVLQKSANCEFEVDDDDDDGAISGLPIVEKENANKNAKWKSAPLIIPRPNLTSKFRESRLRQVQPTTEKINLEEKIGQLEEIVDSLKQQVFFLLVQRGAVAFGGSCR